MASKDVLTDLVPNYTLLLVSELLDIDIVSCNSNKTKEIQTCCVHKAFSREYAKGGHYMVVPVAEMRTEVFTQQFRGVICYRLTLCISLLYVNA